MHPRSDVHVRPRAALVPPPAALEVIPTQAASPPAPALTLRVWWARFLAARDPLVAGDALADWIRRDG